MYQFKRFYLFTKLLQPSTIFKQRNNDEVSCDLNFLMAFLATLNWEYIVVTLCTVTIEKSESTFFLIYYIFVFIILFLYLIYLHAVDKKILFFVISLSQLWFPNYIFVSNLYS